MSRKNDEWAQKCAESNGSMAIVPNDMIKESKNFTKKADEFLAKAKEFDKLNADFDVFAKNFWHSVRKSLEKSGTKEVWGKNIGWNKEAEEDGVKVVNIVTQNQPMQM